MNAHGATVAHVGIVVPARNEAELLPSCLRALQVAVARLHAVAPGVGVSTVVVLDRCTDDSADVVARDGSARAVPCSAGVVGAARQLGVTAVLAETADRLPRRRLWLASTDADSEVPPSWLVEQLRFADGGADAVVGTVRVADADWAEHPDQVPLLWSAGYTAGDGHPHVHGANLGIRASALMRVGGFPPLRVGEDATIVQRLTVAWQDGRGGPVVRTGAIPVRTSARRAARCEEGFAAFLADLGDEVAS